MTLSDAKMKVTEIFYSLQGEGFLAGVPSVFIRLAGCPLRCKWCDTKYAWDDSNAQDYSIEKITQMVKKWQCEHLVVTGGEPMLQPDLPYLLKKLKKIDRHITIETAGIAFSPALSCDLMSISPKLSNSVPTEADLAAAHEDLRLNTAVLRKLIAGYEYQLKFVVQSHADLPEINQTIEEIGNVDLQKVMLMPQAKTREEFLAQSPMVAEMCRLSGFAFSQRLHILLWNNSAGR